MTSNQIQTVPLETRSMFRARRYRYVGRCCAHLRTIVPILEYLSIRSISRMMLSPSQHYLPSTLRRVIGIEVGSSLPSRSLVVCTEEAGFVGREHSKDRY